ncbi:hypothetical protein PG997_008976 [Apiospora hydei]|uniref:Heterokaryon incompatibility domain-containing protein n=1 Tax=Apiospora hydei TaxID=1337664 RepID=A0ABR1WCL3_9PEZI
MAPENGLAGETSRAKLCRNERSGRPLHPTDQSVDSLTGHKDLRPYEYHPLDESKNQIRLATIHPGNSNDPIEITLENVSLDPQPPHTPPNVMSLEEVRATLPEGWEAFQTLRDRILFWKTDGTTTWTHPNPQISQAAYDSTIHPNQSNGDGPRFEALSYAWGSLNRTAAVVVLFDSERRLLRLGENLHKALLDLRQPDEERVMWIDALCIDQSNPEERGHQVAHMAHIYSRARKVVAWLGPDHDDAAKALRGLAHIGSQVEFSDDVWLLSAPGASEPTWRRSTVSLPFDDTFWAAVTKLFDRSWFSRLWVVQEIHMGNLNSVLKCGAHEIAWLQFRHAIFCLGMKVEWPIAGHHVHRLWGMCMRGIGKGFEFRLSRLGYVCHCSDPRDIIHGFLSLAPPELREAFHVDYTSDVLSVYRRLFTTYADLQRRSDLLIFARWPPAAAETTSQLWPSWIPDWRSRIHLMPYNTWINTCASGLSRAEMTLGVEFNNRLQIKGVILDDTVSSLPIEELEHLPNLMEKLTEVAEKRAQEAAIQDSDERRNELIDNYIRNRIIASWWELPSPKQFRHDVLQNRSFSLDMEERLPSWWEEYRDHTDNYWPRMKLFATRRGRPAICKCDIQQGDCIFIPLGCSSPIVIRRADEEENTFRVLGPIYLYGVMDGEALLGELPDPRCILCQEPGYSSGTVMSRNSETGPIVRTDPRLERTPLPHEWEPVSWTRKDIDPSICCRFRNKETGELINHDPRMTSKSLQDRGVNIQEITLI